MPKLPSVSNASLPSISLANTRKLAQRLFHAVNFLWIGYLLPMIRRYMIINVTCIAISAVLWIASVQVAYPDRLPLIYIAVFLGQSSYVNFRLVTAYAEYLQTCSGYNL